MHRAQFEVTLKPEDKQAKEALVSALSNHKIILDFLAKYQLPNSFIETHTYQLKDYCERKQRCLQCQGLSMCAQTKVGYLLELEYDGVLEKVLQPCMYQNNKLEELAHRHRFLLCDMSEEQLSLRFDQINLENEKGSYITLVSNMIEACDQETHKGFYLCGEPGTGKTYLACCFANEMARKNKKVAFVNVPHYISSLKSTMFDKVAYQKQIDLLRVADVVVFDDIAGEAVSNWSRDEILLPILNERMEKKRITLFTSNYDMNNLEKYYAVNSKIINDTVGAKRLVERVKALAFENVLNCMNRRAKNSKN